MNTDTRALIDCNVRVSLALARRIRKAALAEEQGQDIRGSLMIAAGYGPEELDGLRSQVESLSKDINDREHRLASLKAKADKLSAGLSQARSQLGERDATVSNLSEELETAKGRIAALQETLTQSVEIPGQPKDVVEKFRAMTHAVHSGDDPPSAFLAAAGYDRDVVDDALSSIGPLRTANADLERTVTPLRAALGSGGMKAWFVRRILDLPPSQSAV
ncbi:MAG: hypothetical protein GY947_20280 [Rhodobacteraceae bacterium]|nr:hypothetical protein [Paracoccaceae bacterium]